MKILITGCKGFIGAHAMRYFGVTHEVWGCDIFTDYNEKNFYLVNAANADFHHIFSTVKFDLCINCAGAASVPESLKNPGRDFEMNVRTVFLLLEAIHKFNRECKFLNLSSAAVYGNPKTLPVNEAQPLTPVSPYGFHKLQAEKICEEFYVFFGIRTCSLRIFSAYGPGLRKQLLWDLYSKSKESDHIRLFGSGDESRDYIFVEDILQGIDCVITNATFSADIYNLASGKSFTTKAVAEYFKTHLQWEGTILFSGEKRAGDPDYWQADISKIKLLGFTPKISLSEGINRYVQWLKSLV